MQIHMSECTAAAHDAAKADLDTFRRSTAFLGYQRVHDGPGFLEMRVCNRCCSTITVTVPEIDRNSILFAGVRHLKQLNNNAELLQDADEDQQRRVDVRIARGHLRQALALLRRHLPEGLR